MKWLEEIWQPPPEPNSVTLKMEVARASEAREQTLYPT